MLIDPADSRTLASSRSRPSSQTSYTAVPPESTYVDQNVSHTVDSTSKVLTLWSFSFAYYSCGHNCHIYRYCLLIAVLFLALLAVYMYLFTIKKERSHLSSLAGRAHSASPWQFWTKLGSPSPTNFTNSVRHRPSNMCPYTKHNLSLFLAADWLHASPSSEKKAMNLVSRWSYSLADYGAIAKEMRRDVCSCRHDFDSRVPIRKRDERRFGDDDPVAWALRLRLDAADGRHYDKFDPETNGRHLSKCLYCDARESEEDWPTKFGSLTEKNLFVDDYLIEDTVNVERILEKPVSNEFTELPLALFGGPVSAHHNGSHFIIFKPSHRIVENGQWKWMEGVEVATSVNGVHHWSRAVYSDHLHMSRGGEMGVTIDKWPQNPKEKYILAYNCGHPWADEVCLATSADGFNFEDHGHKFGLAADSVPLVYHDCPDCGYKLVLRRNFASAKYWRDFRGTQILTVGETLWSRHLRSDGAMPWQMQNSWYFDKYGKLEPYQRVPYYWSSPQYNGMYFGIVCVFEWPSNGALFENPDPWFSVWRDAKAGMDWIPHDVLRAYLATSRDGVHFNFQWIYAQQPLDISPTETDEFKLILPSPSFVTANGYHYIYYNANRHHHRHRWWNDELLYVAKFRQDRIIGLSPARGAPTGSVLLKPFEWVNSTIAILVNAEMPAGSLLRIRACTGKGSGVELVTIDSAKFEDGDRQEACVSLSMPALMNQTEVQLRFDMQGHMKLFAFTLVSSEDVMPSSCHSGVV